LGPRIAKRHTIAGGKRTAIEAAKAAQDMSRAAAKNRWHRDSAVTRDVRARAGTALAKAQYRATCA
jgi:hypothetical protein